MTFLVLDGERQEVHRALAVAHLRRDQHDCSAVTDHDTAGDQFGVLAGLERQFTAAQRRAEAFSFGYSHYFVSFQQCSPGCTGLSSVCVPAADVSPPTDTKIRLFGTPNSADAGQWCPASDSDLIQPGL